MAAILKTEKLKKIYPGHPGVAAVDEISFELHEGEILGLLGPNGSGKTTTIQMLLGTLSATSGSIFYFGKDFSKYRSEILQDVSFASTYTNLPWILTLEENLKVFGALYGLSSKESKKRFEPLLERFGILDRAKHRVGSLSAGQVTRLMLVKAFFMHPKIVLLDEPTASLDPDIADDICRFLLEQRDQNGLSILFTSHKMEEVMEICDRTIFLKNGHIIANDRPENLARSVGQFRVKLIITDGMDRALAIVQRLGHPHTMEGKLLEVSMGEETIPLFLKALNESSVVYASIKIDEPSLEDYFLHISRSKG